MTTDHRPIVEQAVRDLINDNSDLPIRADFYRGVSAAPLNLWGDRIRREHVETPGCPDEWFVKVMVSDLDVCVSAAGRSFLGVNDVVGEVTMVELPMAAPGVVDIATVMGSRFDVELLAAVREKAAAVAQMRANVGA